MNRYDEQRLANRELNITEFRRGELTLSSLPLAVFVELTQNCNLRCTYCRSGLRHSKQWDMPEELFLRVAEELFPTASLVDLRGWGESTILRHFERFLEITSSYGPIIRLVTNGMNTKTAIWDQLMAAHAVVAVSCDTADPDLFAQIRTGGKLARLKQSVKELVHFRDLYGAPRDRVLLTAVVSRPTVRGLPGLIEMAAELDVEKVVLFPIGINANSPLHLRHDLDEAREYLVRAQRRADELSVVLQLAAALDDALRLPGDVKTLCIHPWAYALIDYAGRVGYCDLLMSRTEQTFGSLFEQSFTDIWNGERFHELRAAHRARTLPDHFSPCRWCYTMRYVDFEHLIHPVCGDKLVTNRTRAQLYQIGVPLEPVPDF
jgi:MoaA/NifB/PqqE/SkfB family radical SAM enzyme